MSIPEVQRYLDRARQDLQAVENNIQMGFYEIAVSRAYYAIFYAASAALASRGIGRSKHSGVLSAFRQEFIKAGIIELEYSDIYGDTMTLRESSDYNVGIRVSEAAAQAAFVDANRLVTRIEQYLRSIGAIQ
jgi:uncharacterized protein (UPF0332 family)